MWTINPDCDILYLTDALPRKKINKTFYSNWKYFENYKSKIKLELFFRIQ